MTPNWQPCKPGNLGLGEVHLWIASLSMRAGRLSDYKPLLSPDEKARADRFKRHQDAERFMAARGSLRSLLGAYLDIDPRHVRFAYDALGKPHLAEQVESLALNFSVSHCDELGLFGFVRQNRIGVDLEYALREIEVKDLAKRYFTFDEFAKLQSWSSDQQREAFYRGWTRKEAYLKARGEGLSYSLDQIEVSLAADKFTRILKAADDPDVSQNWVVHQLTPAADYIGAAAVEMTNPSFAYFKLEPE